MAFELREQVVQSAVAGRERSVMTKAAPGEAFIQGWEHVTTSCGWRVIEEGKVVVVASIDVHGIVGESLVELSAWRGMWDAARASGGGVRCDLLWEMVVIEVETIVAAKVIWRYTIVEGAAIELEP